MNSKRIAIDVTPVLYGRQFGIGRLTLDLITAMVRVNTRFELKFFGRRLMGARPMDFLQGRRIARLRLPRSFEPLVKGLRLIEGICPADFYHATDFYAPVGRKARVIGTIHDLIFLVNPEKMIDQVRLAKWVPEFAKRCDRIITISEYSKHDIVEGLGVDPETVDVTYPGVDADIFFPEPDEASLRARLNDTHGIYRPYFLAVSCSTGRKNTPLLLKTYAGLLSDDPANDLILAWDPPEDIRAQFSAPQYRGRIRFLGKQPDDRLRDLYCGATALIFPSLYEGFGLPVLEAMACGTPVITSNVTSLPEVGGDAAIYIDPTEGESLLKAMTKFENNEPEIGGLRERCIGQAGPFTWERCARKTLESYELCFES